MKIISKVLSTRIKNVLPFLISSNQTAFVKNRFISKSGRVISDVLEIANTFSLESFLIDVDVEKAFDSVNHCFLLQILQKFGFGIQFLRWIKMILYHQLRKNNKIFQIRKRRSTRRSDFYVFVYTCFRNIFDICEK